VASLPYPDSGSKLVLLPTGKPAAGVRGYLYADEQLTQPAEVYTDVAGAKGALIPVVDGRVTVTLDPFGRQPRYWGPASGVDHLWMVINGLASRIDADYDPRLDALETALAAALVRLNVLDGGGGPTPGSGFSVDNTNSSILVAADTAAGLTIDGSVLTVDTILAAGVAVDGAVLVVTV